MGVPEFLREGEMIRKARFTLCDEQLAYTGGTTNLLGFNTLHSKIG